MWANRGNESELIVLCLVCLGVWGGWEMAFWKSSNPFICSGWTDHFAYTFSFAFFAVSCLKLPTRCNSKVIKTLWVICSWIFCKPIWLKTVQKGVLQQHIVDVRLKEQLDSCEWRDTNGSHVYGSKIFKTMSSPSLWGHLTNNVTGTLPVSHWLLGDRWAVT